MIKTLSTPILAFAATLTFGCVLHVLPSRCAASVFPSILFRRLPKPPLPGKPTAEGICNPSCQRKVEMSGVLQSKNVRFQGFLQG